MGCPTRIRSLTQQRGCPQRKPKKLIPEGTGSQKDKPYETRTLVPMLSSERGDEPAQPVKTTIEFRLRGRIRDADVFARSEPLPWDSCHIGLMQQPPREVGGRLDSSAVQEFRDVGIHVKRTLRPGAL